MMVPGLSFGIIFHLSWIGTAQADNPDSVGVKVIHHDMQPITDIASCLKAPFGILLARVFAYYNTFLFKILGVHQR